MPGIKRYAAILLLLLSLPFPGWSFAGNSEAAETIPAHENSKNVIMKKDNAKAASRTPVSSEGKKKQKVDIDLSSFNANMLYAEICNMEVSPEKYEGKRIRLKGEFISLQDSDSEGKIIPDKVILACVVSDTMGCCQKGIEFIPYDTKNFEVPEEGERIILTGTFEIYSDPTGIFHFLRLKDAYAEKVKRHKTKQEKSKK